MGLEQELAQMRVKLVADMAAAEPGIGKARLVFTDESAEGWWREALISLSEED